MSIKVRKSRTGEPMHYCIGALFSIDGKYLLAESLNPPNLLEIMSGHVEQKEQEMSALSKIVSDISGLVLLSSSPHLLEEQIVHETRCEFDARAHNWKIYRGIAYSGEITCNPEKAKSVQLYSPEELRYLPLDPISKYFLKRLKII